MKTKHQNSVSWIILKDHDGSVHLSSNKGVHITCANTIEAHAAFEKLVSNTMDVFDALLKSEMSTIKFHVEY